MLSAPSSYAICRGAIAFVWFYHGLVPKLLGPHEDELAMTMALGLSHADALEVANVTGVLEILMAAAVLLFWRQRWPLLITALAMVGLMLAVIVVQPGLLAGAFNPVTTNLSVLALSFVALQLRAKSGSES